VTKITRVLSEVQSNTHSCPRNERPCSGHPAQSLLTVTNVISHPRTARVLASFIIRYMVQISLESQLRRRAVVDGSVPDCRAGSLVEPWPFLGEHFVEVWRSDYCAKQDGSVWRVVCLWDESRLQWRTCTVNTHTTRKLTTNVSIPNPMVTYCNSSGAGYCRLIGWFGFNGAFNRGHITRLGLWFITDF